MNQDEPFLNLENFILLNKIGEGGFGEVYIVIKKDLETKYVAKISKIPLTEYNNEFKLSLKREVNLLAQIKHPYVVKFIGYSPIDFHEQEFPVIITEYLPNGTLHDIIMHENNNYPPDSWTPTKFLINIFGIASIMSFLHSNGIIHRDLKLSNILLDEYLFPKISDFGLAKIIQTNQNSGIEQSINCIKGTIEYLAPEILSNEENPQYSKASDVYAFGFLIYEMFTHKQTNLGASYYQIVNFVTSGNQPSIDKSIPECYRNLIKKCWSFDPLNRPTFDQIIEEIKSNHNFTKNINEHEFHNYIKLIENNADPIDPSKWFTICPDELFTSSRKVKKELRPIYRDLRNIKGFEGFNQELKDIIISTINKINSNDNKIKFSNEYCIILFAHNWFDSIEFIEILKHFRCVYFELDYPFSSDLLFEAISNLSNINGISVNICLNISDISKPPKIADCNVPISIKIEESVKSIPSNAFSKCTSVYEIDIPTSVRKIEENAFYECESLENIIIPTSVNELGPSLFEKCHNVENVEIESNIKEIKENTFKECATLKKIKLPRSIEKFHKESFEYCKSLNEIDKEILNNLEYIGEYAFHGCEYLNEFIISSKINNINEGVFSGCFRINEITIPKSIITIENDSFHLCTNLNKITFENPSSLTTIKDKSFSVCSELEEISIPDTVREIGKSCFFGCIKLKKITINFIPLVEESTFDGCASLEQIKIPHPAISIESFAFNNCSSLKIIEIPNTVISIKNSSFKSCSSLIELIIPKSVKSIGSNAFKGCISLKKLSIPSSVNEIGESALERCTELSELELKATIKKISNKLFKGCKSLTEINIPETVTEIGIESFCLCLSLKNIKLPKKLTKIENRSFASCISLEALKIPHSVKHINENAFEQCTSLKNAKNSFLMKK